MTKDELIRAEDEKFDKLNKKGIWIFLSILTIGAIIIDILSKNDVEDVVFIEQFRNFIRINISLGTAIIDNFFPDDMLGILVAIMVVIWTFTISLSVNCLEKMNHRYYGIAISDILEQYGYDKIIKMLYLQFIEIVLMVVTVLFTLKITLCAVCITQLYLIPILFRFFTIKLTSVKVIEYLKKEGMEVIYDNKEFKDAKLLCKMIRNLDYKQNLEVDKLIHILTQEKEGEVNIGNVLEITKLVMNMGDKTNQFEIIQEWFQNEKSLDVKKGMLGGILDGCNQKSLYCCVSLIEQIDDIEEYEDLYIWITVYELYATLESSMRWRRNHCLELCSQYTKLDTQEKLEKVISYWDKLEQIKNKQGNKKWNSNNQVLFTFLDEI